MTGDSAIPRIGRYEVEFLLGEGTTSRVYRARDPQIGRAVAIKLLKKQLGLDVEYQSRFEREARSAGALAHPNIATIYDVGRFQGCPYISMEFLPEKSLADLLDAHGKLPVRSAIAIAIQLARALDHAHRSGVIHRDVKPGNILLLDAGATVKLTDFGIAHLEGAEEMQRTQAGTMLGTPRYMSPEQIAGRGIDGRSDLFSLGAVLYEMLTGRKAFESNSVGGLLLQIMQHNPAPIAALAPEVPTGLQRIVGKLLHKRPEQRYANGNQLAEALERELQAVVAREEDAARDKFLPLRIKLAALAGAAMAVVFAICMSIVYRAEVVVIRAQVFDAGASLAKFVAVHSAVPVLDEDWMPLKVFVDNARARSSVDYLVVTDHEGAVRAATEPGLIGKHFRDSAPRNLLATNAGVIVSSLSLTDGRNLFLFDTPILFQTTPIGHVYLGIDQTGVRRVLNATLWLMALLVLLAVFTVAGLSFIFARLIARPLRALRTALQDLAAGDLDRRISEERNDEFGPLYDAFNDAVEKIQESIAGARPAADHGICLPHVMTVDAIDKKQTDATLMVNAARR